MANLFLSFVVLGSEINFSFSYIVFPLSDHYHLRNISRMFAYLQISLDNTNCLSKSLYIDRRLKVLKSVSESENYMYVIELIILPTRELQY